MHATITRKTGAKHYGTFLTLKCCKTPSVLMIISKYPLFSLHEDWLENVYLSITKQSVYTVEFYISLLFHSLTFKPNMRNLIEVGHLDFAHYKFIPLLSYSNFNETGITLSNQPFRKLFERIKANHIFKLLTLLLLERKILLIQNDDNDSAIIIECLTSLMSPL